LKGPAAVPLAGAAVPPLHGPVRHAPDDHVPHRHSADTFWRYRAVSAVEADPHGERPEGAIAGNAVDRALENPHVLDDVFAAGAYGIAGHEVERDAACGAGRRP